METTNYSKFKLLRTNRAVSPAHVAKLKASIQAIGYVPAREVLVNDKFEILDGQHRFIACQELGIPIQYQVADKKRGVSDDDVMLGLNTTQNGWSLAQFIAHHAANDIKCYKNILEFEARHHLGIPNSVMVCTDNKNKYDKIRNGSFIPINPKQEEIGEFIKACKMLPFSKKAHFVYAVTVMFRKCKRKDIDKVLRKHAQMTQQPSKTAYLNMFTNIINKNKPESLHVMLTH